MPYDRERVWQLEATTRLVAGFSKAIVRPSGWRLRGPISEQSNEGLKLFSVFRPLQGVKRTMKHVEEQMNL
jgi:hypothetical protein